jgi:hypothetical protein
MNNCPWKENKTGKDDEDRSDYDDECSGPWKRAKDGNHRLPWVSTGSDMTALSQHESEEEYSGTSVGRGLVGAASKSKHHDTCNCGCTYKTHTIKNALTRDMQLE